jgi:hypothetical protein
MARSNERLADKYPQLEAFFCGYLHQDFPEEHGGLAGAVAAFRRDAGPSERRAVKREWSAFRAETAGATIKAAGERLTRDLGSAWAPRRRADLDELDTLIGKLR